MESRTWIVIAATVVTAAGVGLVTGRSHRVQPKHLGIYTPEGYGGFLPKAVSRPEVESAKQAKGERPSTSTSTSTKAESQIRLAYAAARMKDFEKARVRFAAARQEAKQLPRTTAGTIRARGEGEASLEEDAAYQHAACTAALGETESAEREYIAFMRTYPESPLVHAAVKRIGRLHGGNVSKSAEEVWKTAVKTAQEIAHAREREESLCGPACLAEAFRRSGVQAGQVHELADEMKTTYQGTTLKAMAEAARKRGVKATGLQLTWKGLLEQKPPLIALMTPNHYVLVESARPDRVSVWDPDDGGIHQPARRDITADEWKRAWSGIALQIVPGD